MAHKLYRVVAFEYRDNYSLWLKFDDRIERIIDFEPVLYGEVFGALRDLSLFRQARLDHEIHTVVWPNCADFDPETLRNWDVDEMAELGQHWASVESLILA